MIFILLFIVYLLAPAPVYAMYDPFIVPNNKFGMHIADFNDISDVAPLVNSSGGDWGYITLVASDGDRDSGRWQRMFDQMRRLHLIPLVRIATRVDKDHWVKADSSKFDEIVSFFDALNWPTENRYIILYNETNHSKEWGNSLDPEGFAQSTVTLAKKFKEASEDFFILPAGLDVSAANDGQSMDAAEYMRRMVAAQPEFLQVIDGWTSHSYPNPGFSGRPDAFGRGSVRSYQWELTYLKELGLTRTLPVFITETGWVHREGKETHGGLLSSSQVGENFRQAAESVWSDPAVVAVTPFVFNYQDVPFDIFSFKRLSRDGGYYEQYEAYRSIPKNQGAPRQRESYQLVESLLPPALVSGATYTLKTHIRNSGQGILTAGGYELMLDAEAAESLRYDVTLAPFSMIAEPLPMIEPGEKGEITIHIKTPEALGPYRAALTLRRGQENLHLQTQDIEIVAPPTARIETQLGWKRQSHANDVTVLVYDQGKLIHKFTGLEMKGGRVEARGLAAILPGKPYRVVLLVPYYLPRQAIGPLKTGETGIRIRRMYPVDFNLDGALDIRDLFAMIRLQPHFILSLIVGQ